MFLMPLCVCHYSIMDNGSALCLCTEFSALVQMKWSDYSFVRILTIPLESFIMHLLFK